MHKVHLVTGSSGYLGKKIVKEIISRGDKVIGLDLIPTQTESQSNFTFFEGDIRDESLLKKVMNGVNVVHHTAALVPLTKKYSEFRSVNEIGSRLVAKYARDNNVEFFIHTSSSAVFGSTSNSAIDKYTPLVPIEPYGLSKLKGEIAVRNELKDSNTKLIIIRPRTILGEERGGIFDLFFSWIITGRPIFTIGDGNQLFQFIGSEDLIDAMFCALDNAVEGDFNVGTDDFGTLNEAFDHLINYAKSSSRVIHLPILPTIFALSTLEKIKLSPLAPWHYKTFHKPFFFDIKPLLNLGWKPKFSNNDLLEQSFRSYLEWSNKLQLDNLSPHSSKLDAKILNLLQKLFR